MGNIILQNVLDSLGSQINCARMFVCFFRFCILPEPWSHENQAFNGQSQNLHKIRENLINERAAEKENMKHHNSNQNRKKAKPFAHTWCSGGSEY